MPNNTVRRVPTALMEVVRRSSHQFKLLEGVAGKEVLSLDQIDTSGYVSMSLLSDGRLKTVPATGVMSEIERKCYQFDEIIKSKHLKILENSGRQGRSDGVFVHLLSTKREDKLPFSEILAMFLLSTGRPSIIFSTQATPQFEPYVSPLDFAGAYHHQHENVQDGWLQVSKYIATRDPSGLIMIHDPIDWEKIIHSVHLEIMSDVELIEEFHKVLLPDESQDMPIWDKIKQIAVMTYGGAGGEVAENAAIRRAKAALKTLERACQAINVVNASVGLPPITNRLALGDGPDFEDGIPGLGNR